MQTITSPPNPFIMGLDQIRQTVHLRVEQADERFLRIVHAMFEAWLKEQEDAALAAEIEAVPPNPEWKPMTKEEHIADLKEGLAQYQRGEYFTLEELEKQV